MELHFRPETEARLQELASKTGRATDELVEDAIAGYLTEIGEVRAMLDNRYDDVRDGGVELLDGEKAFDLLRKKSSERRHRA